MGPVILAYIATEFPQDKISKGFSLYMLLSSASVIIGPAIGGLIVSSYGWRTMLWVCVAICAGIFVGCALTSQNQASTKKALQNFDVPGAVLVLIFFSLLLCFAFGDGFSNVFYPTNAALLISLGLADVGYGKWFKWSWPFQLMNLVLTSGLLLFGLAVGDC